MEHTDETHHLCRCHLTMDFLVSHVQDYHPPKWMVLDAIDKYR